MKIIKNEFIGDVHEITYESKFLFWTFTKTYRMKNGVIMRFENGNYKSIGLGEYFNVKDLFNFNPLP